MRLVHLAVLCAACLWGTNAHSATVLILQLHNSSSYPDLNWVGWGVAETLRTEFSAANEIVLAREASTEALRRLSLRSDADFTKASLIKLGQSLDADFLCYGNYEAGLPTENAQLKDSSIRISVHFLDLRKMHEGPDMQEAGKLSELSKLEEHLAWQALKYLQPQSDLQLDRFLAPTKLIRVDAEESYIRGLMSPNAEQQQKWFTQAANLDPQFVSPAFELGNLSLKAHNYKDAITWFQRVIPTDPRYAEARFKMGLSEYGAGEYQLAADSFREVAKSVPLNEVYNNLGAAEDEMNQPVAIDDFRRAADGDPNDPVYLFNLGLGLLKNNYFDEATKRFSAVLGRTPDDTEARSLRDRAMRRETSTPGAKPPARERLKENFDETAFRELKAMLRPSGT